MRQVPGNSKTGYLIVGNGRLSRHLTHYFSQLGMSFKQWHRNSKSSFAEEAAYSSKIILLIPDGEIVSFIENNKISDDKIRIHCSGALSTPLAESAHPMMTFADKLYDLETYISIPFITEEGRKDFSELFPGLSNPSYKINSEAKKYYHAWCSMAGNFTTILWTEFFNRLESKFGIDKKAGFPYLNQIAENLKLSDDPLTGPFARNDRSTIQKHLLTLEDDDFNEVYKAFFNVFNKAMKEKAKS